MILKELSKLIEMKEKSVALNEKVAPVDPGLSLEDTLVELEKRMAAARRAIGLINKLKNVDQRKKHLSSVMGNMNSIRAALSKATKQLNNFERAQASYEKASDLDSLHESQNDIVELTEFTGKQIPHEAWHKGVLYHGHVVFDMVYEHPFSALQRAEERLREKDGIVDMQESYLGYSKSHDLFILGFDGWTEYDLGDDDVDHGNCSPAILFKINKDGKSATIKEIVSDFSDSDAMWYRTNGGLKKAHEKYHDLVDIRLD